VITFSFAVLGVMAAINFFAARHIPGSPLPMQWGFGGRSVRYAPRLVVFSFPVVVGAAAVAFVAWRRTPEDPVWVVAMTALIVLLGQIVHLFVLFRWRRRIGI
jgi:hypothetical protein